ncbi:unnamed protein product, partial [Didymodactylos carnosus]
RKKRVSIRKLSIELDISKTSVHRILKTDLGYRAYKTTVELLLTDDRKIKRKKFANWIRTNFQKEETMRILFSDEKMFDIDGVYNAQNDRVWALDRAEADKKDGVTPLVILNKGTVKHARYIQEVLPVALKYGNQVCGDDWIFQQDETRPHTHGLTQQWCKDNFPAFIDKDHWPPNRPDLNPLDYIIWDEFVHVINWNKVKSKATLIQELKRAVKKHSRRSCI